jgi:hypothetical protein
MDRKKFGDSFSYDNISPSIKKNNTFKPASEIALSGSNKKSVYSGSRYKLNDSKSTFKSHSK